MHYGIVQVENTTPHDTTLHYTTLRYTTLRYTTLHYTTLHYTTLRYAMLRYATLQCSTVQMQYSTMESLFRKVCDTGMFLIRFQSDLPLWYIDSMYTKKNI